MCVCVCCLQLVSEDTALLSPPSSSSQSAGTSEGMWGTAEETLHQGNKSTTTSQQQIDMQHQTSHKSHVLNHTATYQTRGEHNPWHNHDLYLTIYIQYITLQKGTLARTHTHFSDYTYTCIPPGPSTVLSRHASEMISFILFFFFLFSFFFSFSGGAAGQNPRNTGPTKDRVSVHEMTAN